MPPGMNGINEVTKVTRSRCQYLDMIYFSGLVQRGLFFFLASATQIFKGHLTNGGANAEDNVSRKKI